MMKRLMHLLCLALLAISCQKGIAEFPDRSQELEVAKSEEIKILATSVSNSCAYSDAKGFKCWGAVNTSTGSYAEGINFAIPGTNPLDECASNTSCYKTPTSIAGLPSGEVTSIALGISGSMCVIIEGDVYCWGSGYYVLGYNAGSAECDNACKAVLNVDIDPMDGDPIDDIQQFSSVPTKIDVASNIKFSKVVAGQYHTCALTITGALYCWGSNAQSALGIDPLDVNLEDCSNATDSYITFNSGCEITPRQVVASGVKDVALGFRSTCILTTSDEILCAGVVGQSWDGASQTAVESHIFVNYSYQDLSGVDNPDTVADESAGDMSQTFFTSDVKKMFVTVETFCAQKISDDSIECVGSNDSGELGINSAQMDYGQTNPIPLLTGAETLSDSGIVVFGTIVTRCALMSDSVYCWGNNLFHQTGIGVQGVDELEPSTAIAGTPANISHLATGLFASCVASGSEVYCWGDNTYGSLGDGFVAGVSSPTIVPVKVSF